MSLRAPLAVALALVASAATARADGARWSVVDRGDAVEVVLHGATAASTIASPVRERLEVPLVGQPASLEQFLTEATLREIDIRDHNPKVLSIKLRFDHNTIVKLAPRAVVTQVGDDVHVVIPRQLVEAAPVAAPTATPTTIAPAPTPAITAPAPAPVFAPTPTAAPTPVSAITAAVAPAPVLATPAPAAPTPAKLAPASSSLLSTSTMVVGGGAALMGLVALARRRRKATPANALDVIASRSLGGKARVVWLAAGDREIVVAVTAQQVRLLSQWRRTGGRTTAPSIDEPMFAAALASASDHRVEESIARKLPRATAQAPSPRATTQGQSPAVSGILRLRERGTQLDESIATGDADDDEQWAKDVLASMGNRT